MEYRLFSIRLTVDESIDILKELNREYFPDFEINASDNEYCHSEILEGIEYIENEVKITMSKDSFLDKKETKKLFNYCKIIAKHTNKSLENCMGVLKISCQPDKIISRIDNGRKSRI